MRGGEKGNGQKGYEQARRCKLLGAAMANSILLFDFSFFFFFGSFPLPLLKLRWKAEALICLFFFFLFEISDLVLSHSHN